MRASQNAERMKVKNAFQIALQNGRVNVA